MLCLLFSTSFNYIYINYYRGKFSYFAHLWLHTQWLRPCLEPKKSCPYPHESRHWKLYITKQNKKKKQYMIFKINLLYQWRVAFENNSIFGILESRRLIWHNLNNIQALLIFDFSFESLKTYRVTSNPLVWKCSVLLVWHQPVPMTGQFRESLQLHTTSRFTSGLI